MLHVKEATSEGYNNCHLSLQQPVAGSVAEVWFRPLLSKPEPEPHTKFPNLNQTQTVCSVWV